MADGHRSAPSRASPTAPTLDPVQEGFMREHGLQCGFCTPGMMMTARWLLDHDPDPDEATIRRGDLGPDLPVHRLREHRPRRCAGPPQQRRQPPADGDARHDHRMTTEAPTRSRPARPATRSASAGCCARRTRGSCAGRATTSTTSTMPGMLHGAILRSPYAHARIRRSTRPPPRRTPKVQGGHHRRGARDARPGLDADAVRRRAGRAGHRQGALPGPGGRVRRRRGQVLRARRARADRRRLRAAAAGRRRPQGARRRTRR